MRGEGKAKGDGMGACEMGMDIGEGAKDWCRGEGHDGGRLGWARGAGKSRRSSCIFFGIGF